MNDRVETKEIKATGNKNRAVLITVAIILGTVILFFAVAGAILGIKNSRALVRLGSVRADEGVVNYLTAYYKYEFIRALLASGVIDAYDGEDFFMQKSENGKTYGELLREGCESYIRMVVVKAYMFDKNCTFTSSDKEKINSAIAEVLDYKANNSEEVFNERAAAHGFDYSDFSVATEMLYKASIVKSAIFGSGGTGLSAYPEECAEFFDRYSHVKLLFIRTQDKFLLDADGNRVRDENNCDVLVNLTDGELLARQALLSEIRAAISSFETNGDGVQMSPTLFDSYLTKNDEGDPSMRNVGYYFYTGSAYTAEFASVFPNIVKKSEEMKIGSYAEVEYDGGVCFIYKYNNTEMAYTDAEGPFSDFYALCADELFKALTEDFVDEVSVKDEYYEIDPISIPYNSDFIARF